MKKRLILAVMLMLLATLLFSCKVGDGGGSGDGVNSEPQNPGGDSADTEGVIYAPGVETVVVGNYDIQQLDDKELIMNIMSAVAAQVGEYPQFSLDVGTPAKHEIVIGDTAREISATASEKLETRIKREIRKADDEDEAIEDLVGYAVYSDGSSVAVVWSDWHVEQVAIDYFLEKYLLESSLVLNEGYIKTEVISLSDYLAERGEKLKEEKWAELEAALGEEYGPEIVAQLKTLYTLYTSEMVTWMANLYDPETGAWYENQSSRDYYGTSSLSYVSKVADAWNGKFVEFGPTIESTWGGIAFAENTGMAEMFDGDWVAAMPEWIKDGVINWLRSLQSAEDGFFYHPQWPKEILIRGGWQSRLTRDRNSAISVLKLLGSSPLYTSSPAADSHLSTRLGMSTVSAVSKVVSVSGGMLSQFESLDNFKKYIAEMEAEVAATTDTVDSKGNVTKTRDQNLAYLFYSYGNTFQSVTTELNANPDMKKLLVEFFNKHQNKENGTWSVGIYYDSASCLHKIGDLYNKIGVELQYVDAAIDTVIKVLNFDVQSHPATWGVDIYNTWSVFPYIYRNIRNHAQGSDAEKAEKIQSYINKVYESAPTMIKNSFEQIARFRYTDGSFGYYPAGTASDGLSQGVPISVPNIAESGINGTGIASTSLVTSIFGALEMSDYIVPMFTEAERMLYVGILEDLGSLIKSELESDAIVLDDDKTYDFEDVSVGELPDDVKVVFNEAYNSIPGTYAYVQQSGKNKFLEIVAKDRGNDENGRNQSVSFPFRTIDMNANCAVIEMDIKFDSTACSKNLSVIQFAVSYEGTPVLYPTFRVGNDNKVWLYSWDKNPLTEIGMADEVIDLKLEYYWEEGIYKIYVDGMYRASGTDCYTPGGNHRMVNGVGFTTPSTNNAKYTLDNVRCVKVNKNYIDGERELLDERVYNFNNQKLPSAITVEGEYSFAVENEGGYSLSLANNEGQANPTVSLAPHLRSYIATVALAQFDISIPNASENTADAIASRINVSNAAGNVMWQIDVGVNADGKLYFENPTCLAQRVTTELSADAKNKIKLVMYSGAGVGKCDDILFIYAGDTEQALCYTITPYESFGGDGRVALFSFGAPEAENGSLTVNYDNLRVENTILDYESPVEFPEKEPGADSETLNFDDYSVGTLPERITGDAAVGAEIDDSNRFLQIVDDSINGSSDVLIKLYEKEGEVNNNNTVIEFEAEYLTASVGSLHAFILVDKDGNEEPIFRISQIAYDSVFAIRPYTYSGSEGWNTPSDAPQNLDKNPNIITREALKSGRVTGNYVPASKVNVKLIVDWNAKTVQLVFNERYNGCYAGGATTVYNMSLDNIDALKISSYETTTSVLNIDNLTTRSYYTTPPTPNTSPSHSFDKPSSDEIVDYIDNGVKVVENEGSFSYGGYEQEGDDGYLYVDATSGAPSVLIPAFVAEGVDAKSAEFELDLELSELAESNSLAITLVDSDGRSVATLAARKTGSGAQILRTNEALSEDIESVYTSLGSRLELKLAYSYETGYFLIEITESGADSPAVSYVAVIEKNKDISALKLSAVAAAEASFKLYSAYAECLATDFAYNQGDEKLYGFDGNTLPEDFVVTGDAYSLADGSLTVNGEVSFEIPTNIRSYFANAAIVETEISTSLTSASLYEISFTAMTGKTLWRITVQVNENGEITLHDSVCLPTVYNTGVKVSDSELTKIKFEYFFGVGDSESELVLGISVGESRVLTMKTVNDALLPYAALKSVTVKNIASDLTYDNIRVENDKLEYTVPELPVVTPGEDKDTLDLEDYNVGAVLPDRITGNNATVGAELDGSNKYILLDSTGGNTASVMIAPFGDKTEDSTTLEFEIDIEYLIKGYDVAKLHSLSLVDKDGNEVTIFHLYNNNTGVGMAVRALNSRGGLVSGGPNVLSRYQLDNGERSGNGGDMSKTYIKVIVDLETGAVTVTFRGTRDADTFDTGVAMLDVTALKITSADVESRLALDNIRAEYVSVSESEPEPDPEPEPEPDPEPEPEPDPEPDPEPVVPSEPSGDAPLEGDIIEDGWSDTDSVDNDGTGGSAGSDFEASQSDAPGKNDVLADGWL